MTSIKRYRPQMSELSDLTSDSKQVAGLVRPSIMAIVSSEFPLIQPNLYAAQTPPVVYLSGVTLLVAELTIIRAHNRWRPDWTVLVSLSGRVGLVLGLFRMFAASRYQTATAGTSAAFFMALEGLLFVCGLIMTYQAYRRSNPKN